MNKMTYLSLVVMLILPIFAAMTFADELKQIQLMKPQVDGGKPLRVQLLRSSRLLFTLSSFLFLVPLLFSQWKVLSPK